MPNPKTTAESTKAVIMIDCFFLQVVSLTQPPVALGLTAMHLIIYFSWIIDIIAAPITATANQILIFSHLSIRDSQRKKMTELTKSLVEVNDSSQILNL